MKDYAILIGICLALAIIFVFIMEVLSQRKRRKFEDSLQYGDKVLIKYYADDIEAYIMAINKESRFLRYHVASDKHGPVFTVDFSNVIKKIS